MVQDLEVMLDTRPLFEKMIVIWGMGALGRAWSKDLVQRGVESSHILLCDKTPQKCGGSYEGHEIIPPDRLGGIVQKESHVIFIASQSQDTQDDIIRTIKDMGMWDIDIYTDHAVRWGLYLNGQDIGSPQTDRYDGREGDRAGSEKTYLELQRLKFFTFAPLYQEMILIYQPQKVGSTSLHESILNAGKYALHVHSLDEIQYSKGNIKKMAQMHDTRIISLVRDPLARAISLLWYSMRREGPYHPVIENGRGKGLDGIQRAYFCKGFENREFEWFDHEMKEVFDIDIYGHPFDQEKGHAVIEQDGIKVMLLTTEKINDLEDEIGEFLGIDDLMLQTKNTAERSAYRFAYEEYRKRVCFSRSMLDRVYHENKYIRHFYTEEMIDDLFHKWVAYIDDDHPGCDVMLKD